MIDRKILELARKMGHDCYLDQKPLESTIPWGTSESHMPYRKQMIASYNEAKALFEGSEKNNSDKKVNQ